MFHFLINENPQMCHYYGSERRKLHFRESSFEKFPRGTCPRNPLEASASPPAEPLYPYFQCYRKPCLVISNGLSPMRHVRQIAYVRYIKILICLRSFLVIFIIIILFGFPCTQVSSGNCETMESRTICNFDPKALQSC